MKPKNKTGAAKNELVCFGKRVLFKMDNGDVF